MKNFIKLDKILCIILLITVLLSAIAVIISSFGKNQIIIFCCALVLFCFDLSTYLYKKAKLKKKVRTEIESEEIE